MQGSGSLQRKDSDTSCNTSTIVPTSVNTLTQSQLVGAGSPPSSFKPTKELSGAHTLPGSPKTQSHTPSSERSSVASMISNKNGTDAPFGSQNAYSEPQLSHNGWVMSPLHDGDQNSEDDDSA